MSDVEKFDIFNLSYDWKFQVLTDRYVIEFRPKGAKYSEYKSGDTLNKAFQRVFNFLGY